MTNYRFDRIEIRPRERHVLVEGNPVSLGARAFDLLLALVERSDRVVSKNELLDLVWPGLVVEENNLQVQVSALRKVLGPSAIATIPGRGYRFSLSADVTSPADSMPAPAVSTPVQPGLPPTTTEVLIGRDQDLGQLAALVRQRRLVTVLGAAGVGKTALARAVAGVVGEELPIVAWVELAALADSTLIASTIAQALQLPLAGTDAESALIRAVNPLEALLVLDNAEHLVDPLARLVPRLLASAPGLRLLVTSQAPLKLDGEWLFRLDPLSCPPGGATLDQALAHGAVALFAAQMQAAGSRFTLDERNVGTVIDICRQLDGMALAIKLAAARMPLLGLAGLQAGLAQSLKILGGGTRDAVGRRHETLSAAFNWSHGLLAPPEQAVFRRLGVFAGGFSLQAACTVCEDERLDGTSVIDALGALVDRSFVVVDTAAQPRYHLLQTAREYAMLQLERAGERSVIARRHAEATLATLRQINDAYFLEENDALWENVANDIDNVRAAIAWSIENDRALAVQLVGAARTLLITTGLLHEGRNLTDRTEPLLSDTTPPDVAAQFWRLGIDTLQIDARDRSATAALKAVTLLRDGDPRHRAGALFQAIVLTSLPSATKETLLLELRQAMEPTWPAHTRTWLLSAEAAVAWQRGDRLAARNAYQQAVDLAQSSRWRAYVATRLVATEQVMGLLDDAVKHAREAVALARERGPSNRVLTLATLAGALIEVGQLAEAREALVEVVALSRRAGWWRISDIARRFVCLAAREGRMADAARMLGFLKQLHQQLDPLTQPNEVHLQALGEERTRAALAPDDLTRYLGEGAQLDEAAVCELGLAKQDTAPIRVH